MEEKPNSKQVKITYETLFEILQREKNRGELQKLDETFFLDVKQYIRTKTATSNNDDDQSRLFEEQAKLKALHELKNIKKIVKEIYEKRERKIIDLALNRSRTANFIQNPNLLPEEKILHQDLLSTFDQNRKTILYGALTDTPLPTMPHTQTRTQVTTEETTQETPTSTQTTTPNPEEQAQTAHIPTNEPQQIPTEAEALETTTIRFTAPVSQFVGTELEAYGPYEKEDIANIPTELAQVLIRKQKAEAISTE